MLDGSRSEPYLIQYNAWGERIDKLVTSEGWQKLKDIAAKEQLIAECYPSSESSGGGRDRLGPL